MKQLFLTAGAALSILALCGTQVMAADEEAADETGYSFGQVVSISASQIVINEYDFETDVETETTYVINSETTFINADSYMDIQEDDNVDISFKMGNGQMVALSITKINPDELNPGEEGTSEMQVIEEDEEQVNMDMNEENVVRMDEFTDDIY